MSLSLRTSLAGVAGVLMSLSVVLTSCDSDRVTSPEPPVLAIATGAPVVSSTNPSATVRDTTISVHVLGSGFDRGSRVDFAIDGVVQPKLKVNSIQFVKSTDLLANVTVAADAAVAQYDVIVTASTGKKGIGTELMAVLSMIDLGTPIGGYSYGRDVNSSGTVVGEYQASGSSCKRAYVSTNGADAVALPQSSLGCTNYAVSINDAGKIVGHVYGTGQGAVLRWTPTGTGTWALEQLPNPMGYTLGGGGADDISESGNVIADFTASDGSFQQFFWSGSQWQIVSRTAAAEANSCWMNVYGLNTLGQIVGTDCVGALIWQSATAIPTYLPIPAGHGKAVAWDINEGGVVVGKSTNLATGKRRACRWLPDGLGGYVYQDLGDLGGGESEARSINRDGQIGGWSSASSAGNSTRAFIWTAAAGMRGLGTLQNQNATALALSNNDFGAVYLSGWSVSTAKGSYQRAVRWTE